jgi:hypothetical protein
METPLVILTQSIIDVLTKLQQNVQLILETRNPSQYEAGLRQLYTSITNHLKEFQSVLSPSLPPTTPIQEPLYSYTLSFFHFCLDFLKNLHRHISAIHYYSLVNKINFCDETLKAIESYITSNTVREDFNAHAQMVDRVSTLLRQGNISELVPSEKSQTSPGTSQVTYRILTAFLDQYKPFLSTLRNTINLSNEYLSGQLNSPCSQIRNQIITSTREHADSIISMSQKINSLSFYLKQNDIQNVNNVLGGLPEVPSSPLAESPRVSTLSPASAAADGSYYTFADSDDFDDEEDDDDRYYYRHRNTSRRRRYY